MPNTANDVASLVAHRTSATADATAFHLVRSDRTGGSLTYGELQRRIWQVAAMLGDLGLEPGARVLVSAPPGFDYLAAFLGSLHAGYVAVPAYPPRGSRHDERLAAIVRDAAPAVALGTADARDRARRGGRIDLTWHTTEEAADHPAADRALRTAPDGVAFLQYTSGSTGAPKGVVVTHRALLANIRMIAENFALTADDVAVSWLPPYHDMGLVGGLLTPVYAGVPCALMAPTAFAQNPADWLRAISRFRATVSGGPDFGYRLCADRVADEELEGVDLGSWRLAFTGAEPVRARTVRRFTDRFRPYGFRASAVHPCYGLAEATLIVSGAQVGGPVVTRSVDPDELARHRVVEVADGGVDLVSSGRPLCPVRVVTPDGEPTTQVGEIRVGGDGLADGYWGRPQETAAAFPGSQLRTGDLGFLADGELFVTGRVKDVVIVRGRNLYPQDVEDLVTEAQPAAGAVVAFPVGGGSGADGDGLGVAVEVDRHAGPEAVQAVLDSARRAVVEGCGVAPEVIVAVPRASLPRTSSGKMQRGLVRQLWEAGELTTLAGVAAAAAGAVAAGLDPAVRETALDVLGPTPADVPLTQLGLDSLAAARFVAAARRRGVRVDVAELLSGASLAELTVSRPDSGTAAPDTPGTATAARPFWLHEQITPDTPAYTTAAAVRLPADVDHERLDEALRTLLERHPVLRARFAGPEPAVTVDPVPGRVLRLADEVGADRLDGRLTELAAVPMPMAGGGLVRATLVPVRGADPVLLLLAHHAVVDLWSAGVLLAELDAAYRRRELPPPPQARPGGPGTRADPDWWRERLAGIAGRAALPADRPVLGPGYGESPWRWRIPPT
ncbi:AMP-binding protein [Streptomyces sp. NPDC051940]|uniref:AMP-binding protein n=1 Tax=Streptomyces sp. NPDC051940 TaxID=3155675 RepID=UPI00342623E0